MTVGPQFATRNELEQLRRKITPAISGKNLISVNEYDLIAPPIAFLNLTDVPVSYAAAGNWVVRVKSTVDALEFADLKGTTNQVTVTENAADFTLSLPQDIHTGASPTFVTAKLSALTDGYVPYHVSDATGLANSVIRTDGTLVGVGMFPTVAQLEVNTSQIITSTTAAPYLKIENKSDTARDPVIQFAVGATPVTKFTMGVDDDDADQFKISAGPALGTTDRIRIDSVGAVLIGAGTKSNADLILEVFGTEYPVIRGHRTTALTNVPVAGIDFLGECTGNMADDFGGAFVMSIKDSTSAIYYAASVAGIRDGADSTGALQFNVYANDVRDEVGRFSKAGTFHVGVITQATTMVGGMEMATGTAPTDSLANVILFYSNDFVAGNACPYFRTENGTIIGLNQSLLTPDSPTFVALNLSATSNQIVLQSAGVTGTITATPASSNKVWTLQNVTGTIYQTGGTDVAVADGGTGLSSYAVGDLLYASAGTTLAGLADVAVGSYLRSGGVTTAPLWSTLILPNAATAYRLPVATGANTIGELAAVGATGEYLAGATGAIPLWATLNQAAVAGLTTADGPTFAHLHISDLAAITTAAESWVGPSSTTGVYFKDGLVGIGTATPTGHVHILTSGGTSGLASALVIQSSGAWQGMNITVPTDQNGFFEFYEGAEKRGSFETVASGDYTYVGAFSGYVLSLGSDSGGATLQSLNILNNGNVGVNDVAPAEKLDVTGNINVTGVLKIDDVQVVSNRVIDARCDDTIDSGDATTDGVIDALRDAMIAHGLIAAA